MQTLRVLLLQGNPVALSIGYWKYILDWLTDLWLLDEIEILQSQTIKAASSKWKQVEEAKSEFKSEITLDIWATIGGSI